MKKKEIIVVCLVAAILAVVAVLLFMSTLAEIPAKELAYLQLDTKGEDFVLEQIKGVPRERLIECWGEPDGGLFGFFGDIWEISEDERIVVYYSGNAEVEEIRLNQKDEYHDGGEAEQGRMLSIESIADGFEKIAVSARKGFEIVNFSENTSLNQNFSLDSDYPYFYILVQNTGSNAITLSVGNEELGEYVVKIPVGTYIIWSETALPSGELTASFSCPNATGMEGSAKAFLCRTLDKIGHA